ncbi:hypothetical protein AMS68_005364 [Peltaster fructicola]|uniref:Low temperature viability protein n=1 Tax=Peltaster fructicola TaxID=286661 RepID=A0A6H0XYM2_9PEZI|nr:hypothetical protein AMS68_005364 [Peltaster fructicola]
MPRRKFDKKTATTFQLVHRAQNDPLIHDESAPSMVFAEKQSKHRAQDPDDDTIPSSGASVFSSSSRTSKIRHRGDLEQEYGFNVRANEGEAAEHGIFYDDSKYDYMQHMRDLGQGGGQVTWVEASAPRASKGKQKLEDALKELDLGRFDDAQSVGQSSMASSVARSLLPEEMLPSEFVQKRSYQDQQDVPDEIAGFQPDMDPRLREVLEALEDEEYVDDEEDIFAELTSEGREVDRDEWDRLGEQQMFAEDELDDGWESDHTVRARSPSRPAEEEEAAPPADALAQPPADPTEGAWLNEYKKFKTEKQAPAIPSAVESGLSSLASGRRKKRKGARTSTSNYSMSSSALVRTDQQTLLDSRFDKIEEEYAADEFDDGQFDDAMSAASGMTGMSKASKVSHYSNISGLSGVSGISSYSRATDSEAPQLERVDFNSIMDEFLGSHSKAGKTGRFVKRSGPQTGMQQLDEIRAGLGPARLKRPTTKAI